MSQELKAVAKQMIAEAVDEFLMPWGDTWPASQVLFRGCLEHTAYHGGQLAYVQTLLGDTQDHF